MITLTVKNIDLVVSAEMHDFCEIDEVFNMFCVLLEGAGWHRETIKSAILDRADVIREEDNDRTADSDQED